MRLTADALYGLLMKVFVTVVAVRALASRVEVLWKRTEKFVGGFCAQSKEKPVMGWKGCDVSETVMD